MKRSATASGRRSSWRTCTSRARAATTSRSCQPPSPVQHYWTLAVEEQFYLVWPVVLAGVLAVPFLRRRLLWIVLAAAGASLAWSIHSTATDATYAYFSTATRAWELALGAALAIAAPRLRGAAAWLGLACICTAAVAFSGSTPFPGYAALLPTIGAALVIAAADGQRLAATLARAVPLRRRPLVRLLPLALARARDRGRVRGPRSVDCRPARPIGWSLRTVDTELCPLREPDQADEVAPADRRAALARLGGRDPRGRACRSSSR